MTSRRAQRRAAELLRDTRCSLAIVEVEGDAPGCFEIRCVTHEWWTHTVSGFAAAEHAALIHALSMGQTLDRRAIRS